MNTEDKLDLKSPDLVNENFDKIAALFPNCVTESADGKAIDFDLLKQELSHQVVEGNKERYRLEWPGKREAIVTANLPTTKTLRPVREDSVDFDNTENLYIEGDNLEVLKLLQESYLGKIKMIYIDPPYNTGKDFVYKDNFSKDSQEELEESGQKDEYNQRLVANPEISGRYHSDWLSMMYPRLRLARNLLTYDGVIFISIDDNEVHNLRKLCEEIFGEANFISELIWNLNSGSQAGHFTRSHETILVYSKDKSSLEYFKDISGGTIKHGALKKISSANPESDITFKKGTIRCEIENIEFSGEIGGSEKQNIKGVMQFKDGLLSSDVTISAGWAMKNQVLTWLSGKETFDSKGQKVIRFYFNSQGILFYEKERGTLHPKTVLKSEEIGNTKKGGQDIKDLFQNKVMDFPKPIGMMKFFCSLINRNDESIVLDFFSGSASTAHSILKQNSEDLGNRKFIMVQVPEKTNENSEAFKLGFKYISDLGKERIRRAAAKIKEETGANIDYGFRVYRIEESNMQEVYYKPQDFNQGQLDILADNVKSDRTPDDLLAQVMLDWGLPLSLKIEQTNILGKNTFKVAGNSLYACFEEGIDEAFAKEIANEEPLRVVFKDSSFKNDTAKTNVKQLLKQLSPETEMKVI